MTPLFPIIELFDRWIIAKIKHDKTGGLNADELKYYDDQVACFNLESIKTLTHDLECIHRDIWDLEKELKAGREEGVSLEEIGRRAILIRDHNNKRIKIKNLLAQQLSCNVREIKKDHCSE